MNAADYAVPILTHMVYCFELSLKVVLTESQNRFCGQNVDGRRKLEMKKQSTIRENVRTAVAHTTGLVDWVRFASTKISFSDGNEVLF